MLDEFRRIAETATPQPIQSRLVTPDEARAVISSFNRLTDPLRTNFMSLPVDNIVEFSMMQTKKRPSLYNYMNGVPEPPQEPEAPQIIPEAVRDHLDQPDIPEPSAEPEKPKPRKKRIEEKRPEEKPPEEPRSDEKFFTRLTERLEHLVNQPPVIVETTEKHVETLVEIEQAMLGSMNVLTERIARYETQYANTQDDLREMLEVNRTMFAKLNETHAQIATIQTKLIESQSQIVETITTLADKIALLSLTPPVVNPVVNVPAPVVNVSMQEGKRTKIVERDQNNLITKIVEGYED